VNNDQHFKNNQAYRVSVVIPTLNEAANLPHVLPFIPTWVDEVLLVDGYSTESNRHSGPRLAASYSRCFVVIQRRLLVDERQVNPFSVSTLRPGIHLGLI